MNNKNKDNEINSDKKLQNFKNDLKGKFNTMNDEQNLMEIDTNSSSSNTNINYNYNNKKENNSIFQRIKLNFNQNKKKSNNEKYIEENYKMPFINSNNFHNKKNEIKIDNKKSLSYSMLPNNEKQNPNNDLDNWDLSKNIPSTTKEMFQNYFNNLKDPQSYNYFHYKLFDVNGEEISNLSSYQNITKINLFKNEESSKSDKDSDSNSNSNSNNTNKTNKNKSSSSSQKTKNDNSSSSNNKTISKNSNSDSNNSNKSNSKSNSHKSCNSREGSDSNSLKNSGSNSDSNSGSGKNSNSNQNSGSDSNQNSKESKTPSNNYKYSKKHHIKSKSDSFISSCSDLINYNKDSE